MWWRHCIFRRFAYKLFNKLFYHKQFNRRFVVSKWNCWICSLSWYPLEMQKSKPIIAPSKTALDVILFWKVTRKVWFTTDLDNNADWWWMNQIAAKSLWSVTSSPSASHAFVAVIRRFHDWVTSSSRTETSWFRNLIWWINLFSTKTHGPWVICQINLNNKTKKRICLFWSKSKSLPF